MKEMVRIKGLSTVLVALALVMILVPAIHSRCSAEVIEGIFYYGPCWNDGREGVVCEGQPTQLRLTVTGNPATFIPEPPPGHWDIAGCFSWSINVSQDGWVSGAGECGSTVDLAGFTLPHGNHTVTCNYSTLCYTDDPPTSITGTVTFLAHALPSGPPPVVDSDCDTQSGGCSSCGGGSSSPMPSLRSPVVSVGLGSAGGPGAPGGSYNPSSGCRTGQYEIQFDCGGNVWVRGWDCAGKCSVGKIGPSDYYPYGYPDCTFSVGANIYRAHFTTVQCEYNCSDGFPTTVTVTDQDGKTKTFSAWATGTQSPTTTDSYGNTTTFNTVTDGGDSFGALNSVVTPTGTWSYEHTSEDFPKNITKITEPDGSYTDVTYIGANDPGAGNIHTVTANGDSNTTIEYTYNGDGKVATATTASKQIKYDYKTDSQSHRLIMVRECSADGTVTYSRTVYDYGVDPSNTTVVTKKKVLQAPANWATTDETGDSDDQSTTYVYHSGTPYLYQVTDALGHTTTYNVDTYTGITNSVVAPDGVRTQYSYHSTTHALLSTTVRMPAPDDTVLSTEEYSYYTDSSSNPTTWLKSHKDVRGSWTHYVRDTSNLATVLAVQTAGPGLSTEPTWGNDYNNPPTGIKTVNIYTYYSGEDGGLPGQLKTETVPNIEGTSGQVTSYYYWETVDSVVKKRTSPTIVTYHDTSGNDQTTTTHYDDMGRVLSTTDADNRTTWYEYDTQGRQTKTVYTKNSSVPVRYTETHYKPCCGLVDWIKDENGSYTYYKYDPLGRVLETWTDLQVSGTNTHDPDNDTHTALVSYEYDSFGNQHTVTTRSNASMARVMEYTYNKLNQVTQIDYPSGIVGSEYFGYDSSGRLWWKTDGNTNKTLYKYDTRSRLTDVYYHYTGSLNPPSYDGLTADVTYTYEGDSSLKTHMHDSSGDSYYSYDEQGRLKTYTPPTGLTSGYYLEYGYNNAGQKTYVKIRDNTTPTPNVSYDAEYEYYANGWLKKVKNGATDLATYYYESDNGKPGAVGVRTKVAYNNGTNILCAYEAADPRYRLNTISHLQGTTPLTTIDYTGTARDAAGNPKSMGDWTGTWGYDYDANNRLTSATPPNPVPGQPAGGSYGYDWVGNRLNPPSGMTNAMVYNAADQLVRWPGMHGANTTNLAGYTYDYAGNLLTAKDAAGTSTQASYTYTYAGLMNVASYAGRTLTNTWDASSNRVRCDMNGTTWDYVYDATAGIPAVIEEKTGSTTNYYFREPNGSLIAQQHVVGEVTAWHYYHFDELGSTRLLTDSSGDISDKYSYDAWGKLLWHEKVNANSIDQPYQYVGRLGYYTHWQEPYFGLMQLGVRFYDAEAGRFAQRDPIRRASEPEYAYAKCFPTLFTDPDGRLAGRYEDNCKEVCTAKGFIAKCKCAACKKVVDKGCSHPAAKEMCCDGDLLHCNDKCGKLARGLQEACLAKCQADHTKCLIDGSAFE